MKVIINVTSRDIKLGKRKDKCKCPIARATKRVVRKSVKVYVNNTTIRYFDITWNAFDIMNSNKVVDFIGDFDAKYKVKPGKFQIDVPEQYLAAKYTKKK